MVRPSVFMVDGQTDIPFTRLGHRRRRQPCSAARLGLGLLLLLLTTGVAVQGWFLLQLHWRLEVMAAPLQVSGAGMGVGGARSQCHWASVCVCMCRMEDRLRASQGKLIHLSEPQFPHL